MALVFHNFKGSVYSLGFSSFVEYWYLLFRFSATRDIHLRKNLTEKDASPSPSLFLAPPLPPLLNVVLGSFYMES